MGVPEEHLTDRALRNWLPTPAEAPHAFPFLRVDSAPSNVIMFPGGGVSAVPSSTVDNETEQRFRQLADTWLRDTGFLSDPIRKFMDRSHLKIIAMGAKVLPLILRELEKKSGFWFVALDAVSPENPVRPEDQASFDATANAWLRWGKQRGLI